MAWVALILTILGGVSLKSLEIYFNRKDSKTIPEIAEKLPSDFIPFYEWKQNLDTALEQQTAKSIRHFDPHTLPMFYDEPVVKEKKTFHRVSFTPEPEPKQEIYLYDSYGSNEIQSGSGYVTEYYYPEGKPKARLMEKVYDQTYGKDRDHWQCARHSNTQMWTNHLSYEIETLMKLAEMFVCDQCTAEGVQPFKMDGIKVSQSMITYQLPYVLDKASEAPVESALVEDPKMPREIRDYINDPPSKEELEEAISRLMAEPPDPHEVDSLGRKHPKR